MELTNSALRPYVAASLKHSLKSASDIPHESIPLQSILYPRRISLGAGNAVFKELCLRAEEFYASERFLIAFRDGCLFIYTYTRDLHLKLCKKVEICYLLYKRQSFKRKIRHFLYRVYVDLIENGVYRYDAWFEAIVAYLNLDQAEDITEYENGIAVLSHSGAVKYFDSYLNPIDPRALILQASMLGDDQQYVVVGRKSIRLYRNESAYVSRRRVGAIRQHVAVGDLLFLLMDRRVIVAKYA